MRLIELRLKNLNSLKGEWYIDFADPAFINEGIFAITGQTGAGKTTILDAICLALYGETPRINSISKSSNEVMTRQTADCFAEVVIALNGSQYRCRWGQRRAYGKSDGNLQDATHEIAKLNLEEPAKDDEILETKLSRTKEKIIELTRMDFQQFTRSILLAQGSFSAFLKAKADERADILEKITGTDIYATISEHVHEKKRAEEDILSKLQFGLEGLSLLDSAQEAELKHALTTHQTTLTAQQHTFKQLNEQLNWLDAVHELQQKQLNFSTELEQAKQAQQAFIPDATRLAAANKALEIDSQYSQLVNSRDNIRHLTAQQQQITSQLAGQQVSLQQAANRLTTVHHLQAQADNELHATLPIIIKVRALDADIRQQAHSLSDYNQRQDTLSTNLQCQAAELVNHQQQQVANQAQLASTDKYLEDNSQLSDLDTDTAIFDSNCSRLKALLQDNISQAQAKKAVDAQAKHYQQQLAKLAEQQTVEQLAIATARQQLSELQQQQAALLANKSLADRRIEQEQIEHSSSQVEQIKAKIQQLTQLSEQINAINSALPIINDQLLIIEQLISKDESAITETKLKRQDKQQHLDLLQRVAKLEDYIVELEEHSPCPLCGATEHPYAKHHPFLETGKNSDNSNQLSPTMQTKHQLNELDKLLDSLQHTLSAHRIDYATKQTSIVQQQQQLTPLYNQVKALTGDIEQIIATQTPVLVSLPPSVSTIIAPLTTIAADMAALRQQLEGEVATAIITDHATSLALINTMQQQLAEQRNAIRAVLAQYENLTSSLTQSSKVIETKEQQYYKLAADISAIESDLKLSLQKTATIDSTIENNFYELATVSSTVQSLVAKYPLSSYVAELTSDSFAVDTVCNTLPTVLPLLSTSIDQQTLVDAAEADDYIEQLRQYRSGLVQLKKLFNSKKQSQQTLFTSLSSLNTQIKTQQMQLDKDTAELDKLSETIKQQTELLNQLRQDRKQQFDHKHPDEEESRLRSLVAQATNEQIAAQRLHDNTAQALAQLEEKQQQLIAQLQTATQTMQAQQQAFATVLAASQFTDEAAFVAARLPLEQRRQLTHRQQSIDNQLQQVQSLLTQTSQALKHKLDTPLTVADRATLAAEQQQMQDSNTRLSEMIGAISGQLKDNNDKKSAQQHKRQAIDEQKQKLQVWQQLHKLIGSADGKKYRTFAQGLTFDIMVRHANTQLHKMSDRYLLIRDDNNALELNVIDNYQGGEVRSTKNLSGGEGFIISLALALGLSQMASHNIRVDSLFLDEGFGTLDDESLDIALDTLTSLQQEGKLIGVISHVQALKERILTQIQVKKLSGGFSEISGQGCHKIIS